MAGRVIISTHYVYTHGQVVTYLKVLLLRRQNLIKLNQIDVNVLDVLITVSFIQRKMIIL